MVLQDVSKSSGKTDITFTCPREVGGRAVEVLSEAKANLGIDKVLYDDNVGKVSLVGAGMKSHPGVTATFCESLSEAGINIELISTSEIRISALVREEELDECVRALHAAFELGGEEEAQVYAGTGRCPGLPRARPRRARPGRLQGPRADPPRLPSRPPYLPAPARPAVPARPAPARPPRLR